MLRLGQLANMLRMNVMAPACSTPVALHAMPGISRQRLIYLMPSHSQQCLLGRVSKQPILQHGAEVHDAILP